MKRFVCIMITLGFILGCSAASAEQSATEASSVINPENYPYFYVTKITQTEESSPVVISGCFGDFQNTGDDSGANLQTFGFDESSPVTLPLATDCEILLPKDLLDNITENIPCDDILRWFQAQSEALELPFTFYAVLTLNESDQVTKLAYQYFTWG